MLTLFGVKICLEKLCNKDYYTSLRKKNKFKKKQVFFADLPSQLSGNRKDIQFLSSGKQQINKNSEQHQGTGSINLTQSPRGESDRSCRVALIRHPSEDTSSLERLANSAELVLMSGQAHRGSCYSED